MGALPVAALVGIRWPYHPLQLRYRWQHRRPLFRMLVRWGVLILVPYGLIPLLAVVMMIPAIVILVRSNEANSFLVNFVNGIGKDLGVHITQGTRPISTGVYTVCVLVTCAVAVLTWFLGRWANLRVIRRRRDQIEMWLSDPTMG